LSQRSCRNFSYADHLATPRLIADENQKTVWRWDQAEPFGATPPNEDPDGDGVAFDLPLRLPGQYYDRESGLHYNYYRDYDPTIGRYAESDLIGLRAGLNTYAYVHGEPLRFVDVLGLDVRICFFPLAASGLGHVGIGIAGAPFTYGFYPNSGASVSQMFSGTPGQVVQDPRDPNALTGATCQIIPATRNQDDCISRCIERRAGNPGTYKLLSRQCTSFARDCLTECVLPSGNQNTPYPATWYQSLPGGAQFPYFPTPNVPVPNVPTF
jgi:RHS repeat-associated protein